MSQRFSSAEGQMAAAVQRSCFSVSCDEPPSPARPRGLPGTRLAIFSFTISLMLVNRSGYREEKRTMRQTRWNPFGGLWTPLQQFQSEMNRLFDRWLSDNQLSASFPALNVWEDEEHCYVEAELPGVELKDLEIFVQGGNQLTVKGERKPVSPDK